MVCPQSLEDEVRLDIDKAIKAIRPSVFPNVYDVKFTPVFYELEVPKGNWLEKKQSFQKKYCLHLHNSNMSKFDSNSKLQTLQII